MSARVCASIAAAGSCSAVAIDAARSSPSHAATLHPVSEAVAIEARTRQRRPLLGATQRYPFELLTSSSVGQTLKSWGMLIVKPVLPPWVLPVLCVLLLLALSGAGIGYKRNTDRVRATETATAATAVFAGLLRHSVSPSQIS